jgi:hypothetical protein
MAPREEIDGEFATTLKRGDFERVRDGLLRIADQIDPGGRLGEGDSGERRESTKYKVSAKWSGPPHRPVTFYLLCTLHFALCTCVLSLPARRLSRLWPQRQLLNAPVQDFGDEQLVL